MKTTDDLRKDLIQHVQESAEKTEKIVGSKYARAVKKISDSNRRTITVPVNESSDVITVEYVYRDAVRFRDMGAGKGFHKGRPNSATIIGSRRPVKISNRPIHRQINLLSETVDGAIVDFAVNETIPANLLNIKNNG
jgi:hypothetical protein